MYSTKVLSEVVLPENLTEIEDGVFYECYSMKKVTFPLKH